jgi:transcription antitermination factor NusG
MLKNALKSYTTKRDFQYGDVVKIGNGPFENVKGEVEEVNDTHITILLNSIKVKLSLSNSKLSLAR